MTFTRQKDGPREHPHIVILGAGFAGIEAVKALSTKKVRVTLVDQNPYTLFQPLLYQVASGLLDPSVVATPVKDILADQKNAAFHQGRVERIDTESRLVHLEDQAPLAYDRLIIATGASTKWDGHGEFARFAQPLKTLADAETIAAGLNGLARTQTQRGGASAQNPARIVIVGGGPTGVELAGAIIDQTRRFGRALFGPGLKTHTNVTLVEAGPRLMPSYGPKASAKTRRVLMKRGVDVHANAEVTDIGTGGLTINGKPHHADLILWTAGVKASPAAQWLGVHAEPDGRIAVQDDLSVPGLPDVFIAGDLAAIGGVPGLAPAAKQMGKHAAGQAYASLKGRAPRAFRYRDLGEMAVIADGAALARIGPVTLWGEGAWAAWLAAHIYFLPNTGAQAEAAAAMVTRAAVNPEPVLARLPDGVAQKIRATLRAS